MDLPRNSYHTIIIGGGPVGLGAGMYAGRLGLKTLILAKVVGGTIILTDVVENYPGFKKLTGQELTDLLKEHALDYKDVSIKEEEVIDIKRGQKDFEIVTENGSYIGKTIIFATGTKHKELNAPGVHEFANKGVHFCALCLHPDEEIVVNSSITKIKDITPVTNVLTHDGTYREITGFTKTKYNGKLVKIRSRFFNEPVLLTPNHPILTTKVIRGVGKDYWKDFKINEPGWVEAGRIEERDCVLYPIIKETKDLKEMKISDYIEVKKSSKGKVLPYITTTTSNEVSNKIPITKDFMRLVGYYLAEGSAHKHNLKFYFNKNEKEYIEDTRQILESIFKLKTDVKYIKNICSITVYSKILCDLFKHLFGSYSYNKGLPHWCVILPTNKQKELIKGLWRGDGCLRDKDFAYVTSSRKLAYQLRDLLLRQETISSLQRRDKRGLNRYQNKIEGRIVGFNYDKYVLTVGGQFLEKMSSILNVEHPKIKKRKLSFKHAWIKDGYAVLPIRSIETVDYKGYVLNIGVKENNTYIAKNFIVHNCDGPVFKDKIVAVIGGSDSAAKEALVLSRFAKKVYIIYRGENIHPEPVNLERINKTKNIEIVNTTNVTEVKGNKFVTSIMLDKPYKGNRELKLDGIFISIGLIPLSDLAKKIGVKTNDKGEIIINRKAETNVEGVFAAGDVVDTEFKQAITGVGEGVTAAYGVYKYCEAREVHPV